MLNVGKYEIESESNASVKYTLTVKDSGEIQCSCKGWIYRRKCKHTTAAHNGEYEAA